MSFGIVPCTTDNLIVGTYSLAINSIDLGSTTGGVTISKSSTYTDVFNDQSQLLQGRFETEQTWTVTTTLRELPLGLMRILYGVKAGSLYLAGTDDPGTPDPDQTNGARLCFGQDPVAAGCTFPEEFCLTICGPGPGCGCRTWHFPRVVITPTSLDYVINRDEPVGLEIEFTPLSSCPSGIVGCVYDSLACGDPADVPVAIPPATVGGAIVLGSIDTTTDAFFDNVESAMLGACPVDAGP